MFPYLLKDKGTVVSRPHNLPSRHESRSSGNIFATLGEDTYTIMSKRPILFDYSEAERERDHCVRAQGQYITPRVINLALQYLTTAVGLSSTWKPLKAHMGSLLGSVVFPLCSFNDEDEELWQDDPQEYIRKVCFIAAAVSGPAFIAAAMDKVPTALDAPLPAFESHE